MAGTRQSTIHVALNCLIITFPGMARRWAPGQKGAVLFPPDLGLPYSQGQAAVNSELVDSV